MRTQSTLTIGRLAQRAGVPIDTIRYYERTGLLPPAARSASGYRRYETGAVDRLRFIRRAQKLGFSLAEIEELLALSARDDVAAVRSTARAKLASVEHRIRELERVRDALTSLVDSCPGHGRGDACPILHALAQPESDA